MDGQGLDPVTDEPRQYIEEENTDSSQVEKFDQEQSQAMDTGVAANVEIQAEAEPDILYIVEESDSKEIADQNHESPASHQIDSARPENAENRQDQSVAASAEIQPQ